MGIVAALVTGGFLFVAPAAPGVSEQPQVRCDRGRLKDRVTEFYRAAAQERWSEVYSFVAADTKRDYPLDTFVPKFQRLQPNKGASIHITKIDCDAFCTDSTDPSALSAEVWMTIFVTRADGGQEKYRGFYDCWKRTAEGWFWVYGTTESN
jgi:hypothetical protein